eukprot:gene13934-19865_t
MDVDTPGKEPAAASSPATGEELENIDIALPVLAIGPDNEKILRFSELFKQEDRDLHRFYREFMSDLDRKVVAPGATSGADDTKQHRVKTRQERREASAKGGQGGLDKEGALGPLDEEDEALVLQQLPDEETLHA